MHAQGWWVECHVVTCCCRNVVLEKVFELQSSSPLGLSTSSPAADAASPDEALPSTSGSDLVPYNLCHNINMPVNIKAILGTRSQQQSLIQFTPAELNSLEWTDFVKLWKEYISR